MYVYKLGALSNFDGDFFGTDLNLRPSFYKIDTFVSKWHPNLKKYIFCTRVYHLCCTVMCTKTTHQPHNPIKHRVKYLYKSNTEKNVYTTIFYLPWETFLDTHIISFDVIFSVAVALLAIKWTQQHVHKVEYPGTKHSNIPTHTLQSAFHYHWVLWCPSRTKKWFSMV